MHLRFWPFATNFSLGPDVSFRDEAEVDRAAEFAVSVANDAVDGAHSVFLSRWRERIA